MSDSEFLALVEKVMNEVLKQAGKIVLDIDDINSVYVELHRRQKLLEGKE